MFDCSGGDRNYYLYALTVNHTNQLTRNMYVAYTAKVFETIRNKRVVYFYRSFI